LTELDMEGETEAEDVALLESMMGVKSGGL
jgi:hypothetical protein